MMLGTIERLISLLDADGIRYCHWQSSWTLARTLEGDTDLDMLIHPLQDHIQIILTLRAADDLTITLRGQ